MATCEIFRNEGAEVVLLDSSKPKDNVSKDIFFHCDVTNRKQVREVFSKISVIYGGIDILVSNAGSVYDGQIGLSDHHKHFQHLRLICLFLRISQIFLRILLELVYG